MFEIDHVQSPPPLPAQPMLASDLLLLEQKQRKRFTGNSKLERIKTGCVEVDELLGAGLEDGGFERGVVLGISAGDEGRLVSPFLTSFFEIYFGVFWEKRGTETEEMSHVIFE